MTVVRQETVTFKGFTLTKDLTEDQILCGTCKGAGLVVHDYPYGLQGERRTDGKLFPYDSPFIGQCPNCYIGVQTICQYCGKPYPKGRLSCQCDGVQMEKDAERAEKLQTKVEKATRMTVAEAVAAGVEMVYSEGHESYYSWDELGDMDPEEMATLGIVWACVWEQIAFDAGDLIDNACEDLHEDAFDRISIEARKELQDLLDRWADQHGKWTRTFHPDHTRVIEIDIPAPTEQTEED